MFNLCDNAKINTVLNDIVKRVNNLAEEQLDHINRLTEIGLSLSQDNKIEDVFDLILSEAIAFTNADGATIYSVTEDKKSLEFALMVTRSKGIKAGGKYGQVKLKPVPIYREDGLPNMSHQASCVFHTKEFLEFDDYYHQDRFDPSGTIAWDKANDYRCKSMLAIPLMNHEKDVLGVIQLINAIDKHTGEIISFPKESITMVMSLASQAAIALTNKYLIYSLEKLFKEFIKAIALALDRKSKHTGGHIERVAKICMMIANKVNSDKTGYYKNVEFSKIELDELSIAAWLHDVGKIATPDHIMNKATKLNLPFDKIDLIDSRKDTILALHNNDKYIQTNFKNRTNFNYLELEPSTEQEYQQAIIKKIEDDFLFLQEVNIGGEYFSHEKELSVKRIAKFVYFINDTKKNFIEADELKNLLIARGTHTNEETKIMHDHVKISYEILNQMSYPKRYSNVPIYASSHHEKMNGDGYPWGFSADELPLQSRILAVSDIFEALTAPDRPYKSGKKLSESMKILAYMVKDGHIDKNLFKLILDSNFIEEYSEKHIPAIQQDEIDKEKLLEMINNLDDK